MERFPPLSVETERCLLRQPEADDADEIFRAYARDPQVTRYVAWRPHASIDETKLLLERYVEAWKIEASERNWVIERLSDRALLGMIGFRHFGCRINLGYVLARAYHGSGYMTEAAKAVCAVAFRDPSIFRIEALCDVENQASARVMQKAGMQLEGTLRRYAVHPNLGSMPRDCFLYARVR